MYVEDFIGIAILAALTELAAAIIIGAV